MIFNKYKLLLLNLKLNNFAGPVKTSYFSPKALPFIGGDLKGGSNFYMKPRQEYRIHIVLSRIKFDLIL